jgi:hypothetical protein
MTADSSKAFVSVEIALKEHGPATWRPESARCVRLNRRLRYVIGYQHNQVNRFDAVGNPKGHANDIETGNRQIFPQRSVLTATI